MAGISTLVSLPLEKFELPWYDFDVTLDGARYNFTIRYNQRIDRWFMDIADAQLNPLVSGIKLMTNRLLTEAYKNGTLPTGYFFVVDNTGNNADPTLQSFLKTHTLYYASTQQ